VISRYIQEPLEIPAAAWPVQSGGAFESHAGRVVPLWSGTSLTARAAARVGEMMRDHGRWQSRTVLDSTLVLQAVTPGVSSVEPPAAREESEIPRTGLGWWTNQNRALPELPPDAFLGVGDGGQLLLVVPSMDLIVVRFGSGIRGISMGAPFWRTLRSEIVTPLMECFRDPEAGAESRRNTPPS
jgi:CubicO group peptidase (beta-lactamase class C family)